MAPKNAGCLSSDLWRYDKAKAETFLPPALSFKLISLYNLNLVSILNNLNKKGTR